MDAGFRTSPTRHTPRQIPGAATDGADGKGNPEIKIPDQPLLQSVGVF